MVDVPFRSAQQLARDIRRKKIGCLELLDLYLARVEKYDGSLNAVVVRDFDRARTRARAADRALAKRQAWGPLHGVPMTIKESYDVAGLPTTWGVPAYAKNIAAKNAVVVDRLLGAGVVLFGKTNVPLYLGDWQSFNAIYGTTNNPWDVTRAPGGSSGGSAAAVAAGAVAMALGSETGGSVRQPAAFCGVVGIKPSYGRVSRYGLVAFGSSLDQIGTFGTDVTSAARLLAVVSGRDPLAATTLDRDPLPPPGPAPASLAGTVIGVPREYFGAGLHPGVAAALERAKERLRGLGAELRDVSLPHTRYAVPAYYVIAPAEASSNLARYDGVRYGRRVAEGGGDVRALYRATRGTGFGPEVRRRILLGTYVLSAGYYDAYYARAQRARERIRADFARAFAEGVDALLAPTTPTPAFRLGEKLGDPVAMYLSDVYTCTANLAGVPALSLPLGRDQGLPIGGQFLGPLEGESAIVRIAQALERVVDGTAEVR